ncbi:hypothetical protein SGPA1_20757 [Streptomyces misionensis JCM 4497]
MIRLVAQDDTLELSEEQVSKIKFWLLEFLPARTCEVSVGPGAAIVVPDQDRGLDDLAVLFGQVGDAAGWWVAVDAGVGSVVVVPVQPVGERRLSFGV